MGRPTKLTPEVQDRIVQAIAAGNYIEIAAAYAGIHRDTLYGWIERGKAEPGSIYSDFSDAVESARAQAEVRNVALIQKAATRTWQAAAWHLERTSHQRWGRRTIVSGDEAAPVRVEVSPKESLAAKLTAMLERAEANSELLGDDSTT